MKTFKTITFVTATTAVVAVATLFTVEETKIEKDFFEDEAPNSMVIGKEEISNHNHSSRDTLPLSIKKPKSAISETISPPIPESPTDSLEEKGILTR